MPAPPHHQIPCREACGACCIAPSLSPCEALPRGKPAGTRCPYLSEALRCELFGRPERPRVCVSFRPEREMCGDSAVEATATLVRWELLTQPR